MPSSPKIPREVILQHALEMLIQEGYSAINIKTLAKKIGCSTQPISRHFNSMPEFRNALTEYALNYTNIKMEPQNEGENGFEEVGMNYLNLAFDEPNLFKYLYMSGDSGYEGGGLEFLTNEADNAQIIKQIAKETGAPEEAIKSYFQNTLIYTHGLACFIASGIIKVTKEEAKQMILNAGTRFEG